MEACIKQGLIETFELWRASAKGWKDATKMDGGPTLADQYDYVCHGKIYKFEDGDNDQSM